MKISTLSSVTLSALALVLAVPHFAEAKSSTIPQTTVNRVPHTTINRVVSGSIDNTKNGVGTYTTTITGTRNDKTIITTDTFADGVTYTTKTVDLTKKTAKGLDSDVTVYNETTGTKTVTDEVISRTAVAGDYDITGKIIQSNGVVDTINGTKDKTIYGTNTDLSVVNMKTGQMKSTDDESMKSGNASLNVYSVNGTVVNASLKTNNALSATVRTVDNSTDGHGVYSVGVSHSAPNTGDITIDRVYQDGAGSSAQNVLTSGTNGFTNYDQSTQYVSPNHVTTTSYQDETYTNNPNGSTGLNGTFGQPGYKGTLTGTQTTTNYGHDIQLSYTSGTKTETTNTQQLLVGGTLVYVTTGTSFNGKPINNIDMSTGY